jgi:hypothetical protein
LSSCPSCYLPDTIDKNSTINSRENIPIKKHGGIPMTINPEDQRKQAFEMFVKALQAAPDSLIKSLTGKEYAKHTVDGTQVVEEYLYPKNR